MNAIASSTNTATSTFDNEAVRTRRLRGFVNVIVRGLLPLVLAVGLAGCGPAKNPDDVRSPTAQKWFDRARTSFEQIDMDDAQESINEALRLAPNDAEIRLLAANLALAKLDYDAVVLLTEGTEDSKALALRGRAQWYAGKIAEAGKTLDALLRDPDVHDPWARAVSKLANRGTGRRPFHTSGNIVAAIEMPPVRGSAMIVPVEIDGEQGLALLSTGNAEVVLDKTSRKEPSWVSLRFDGRVEFQDVPALTLDLSGLSRTLGAPIKAMLGVSFFRHANVTFDFLGKQFVVRQFSPPRPPACTELPVYYIRGGGMVIRSALNTDLSPAQLLLDSSQMYPLVLDANGWRKAGVDPATLVAFEGDATSKRGLVPLIRLGGFDIPQVGAVMNGEVEVFEKALGLDLDGIVGAGLLGAMRVTFGDSGRVLWLEEDFIDELNALRMEQEAKAAAQPPAQPPAQTPARPPSQQPSSTPPATPPKPPASSTPPTPPTSSTPTPTPTRTNPAPAPKPSR